MKNKNLPSWTLFMMYFAMVSLIIFSVAFLPMMYVRNLTVYFAMALIVIISYSIYMAHVIKNERINPKNFF